MSDANKVFLDGIFILNDMQYICIRNYDLHLQLQIGDFFKNTLKKLMYFHVALLCCMLHYNAHVSTCDA